MREQIFVVSIVTDQRVILNKVKDLVFSVEAPQLRLGMTTNEPPRYSYRPRSSASTLVNCLAYLFPGCVFYTGLEALALESDFPKPKQATILSFGNDLSEPLLNKRTHCRSLIRRELLHFLE